jgi:hypothetical protein
MVTHAELPEAQFAKPVFALLDAAEGFAGHGTAIGDAGRKAGRCRFVPHLQAGAAGQLADVLLGQSGFGEGSEHPVLPGGRLAGPKIALVIDIHAVGKMPETEPLPFTLHHGEEFVFAMKAAKRVVLRVIGIVEFGRWENFQRDAMVPGETHGIGQMTAGERGRIRDDGPHVRAKSMARAPGQIGRIDSAGIGDQNAAKFTQTFFQSALLLQQKVIHDFCRLIAWQKPAIRRKTIIPASIWIAELK